MQWFERWKKRQREKNTLISRVYDRLHYYYRLHSAQWEKFNNYDQHVTRPLTAFKKYGRRAINQATYYEIGVGEGGSLIGLSLAGMHQIFGTDVNRLISKQNLITNLKNYQKYAKKLGLTFPSGIGQPNNTDLTQFLRDNLRIDYRAPYGAMQTDLPSNSVDYIGSFTVFEHIPKTELVTVLKEHYRLLKPGGVFYCNIDFRDHIVYNRKKENRYAYLRYSPVAWQASWQNSNNYYQNRLRTKDYLALFAASGFRVLEMIPQDGTPKDVRLRELAKINIDPSFAHYTTDELLEEGCIFILTKD